MAAAQCREGIGAWRPWGSQLTHFTEPTTPYWQTLHEGLSHRDRPPPPYEVSYPVALPDGRVLHLPLRALPDGVHAVASFIANQASFTVLDAIAAAMADLARSFALDVVVGLPTLGLALAPLVARELSHTRFVPLGYSRKFWYDDALSEPITSITSPGSGKRIYLDPNQRALLEGRRVCIVDDAVSSGASLLAVQRLFMRTGISITAIVVAMKQTTRWQPALSAADPALPPITKAVFGCPLFTRKADGWWPVPESAPDVP